MPLLERAGQEAIADDLPRRRRCCRASCTTSQQTSPPKVQPHERPEADAVFGSRCDFVSWPSVPIRVLCGADDRFFPVAFQRGVARDRLDVIADVRQGGHLIALAHPDAVVDYLLERS